MGKTVDQNAVMQRLIAAADKVLTLSEREAALTPLGLAALAAASLAMIAYGVALGAAHAAKR